MSIISFSGYLRVSPYLGGAHLVMTSTVLTVASSVDAASVAEALRKTPKGQIQYFPPWSSLSSTEKEVSVTNKL